MAFKRDAVQPGFWLPGNSDRPQGNAKSSTTPTSKDGSPWSKLLIDDYEGFFQGLLFRAGITPSGNPDTVLVSDYINSLQVIQVSKIKDITALFGFIGKSDGQQVNIGAYHVDTNRGGGIATWDATLARSNHNGGSIHSPARDLDSEGLAAYLISSVDVDLGCWVIPQERVFNPERWGAFIDGSGNDSLGFQAMADFITGKAIAILSAGDYNFVDLISYDPAAKNIVWMQDTNVTMINPVNLYAPGVQPNLTAVENAQTAETFTSGDDITSAGLYISYFQKSTGLTSAYEKDAIHGLAKTSDVSAPATEQGVVGIRGTGVISSTNTDGQAWAMNAFAQIDAGGDGLLHAIEANLNHFGSDNAIPDTVLAKYGLNLTTKPGSVAGTAAIKIGSGSNWHYGLFATLSSLVSAASKFINLKDLFTVDGQGRIAVGHESPTEQIDVRKASGRSQVAISSDGAGAEASTRYTDLGTRNWSVGLWMDTGRYTIAPFANLSTGNVLDIDNDGNFGFNGFQTGSGQGVLFVANAGVVPSGNPVGGGLIYVEGGALKFRGSSGTVTTIAPA